MQDRPYQWATIKPSCLQPQCPLHWIHWFNIYHRNGRDDKEGPPGNELIQRHPGDLVSASLSFWCGIIIQDVSMPWVRAQECGLWRMGQSNQQRYQVKNGPEQQEAASFMSLCRDQRGHFPHIPPPNTDPTHPNTFPSCRQDSLELGLSCASKTSMLPKEELQQDPETAHAGRISSECCLYSLGTPLSVRWLVKENPARLNCGSDLFLLILLKQSNVGKWRSKIGQPATLHFKCSTAAGQSSEVHTTVELVLATRAILFQFVLWPPSYVISCLQTIDVHNMMARKRATGIGRTSCIPWSHKSLRQSWAAQLLGMLVPSRNGSGNITFEVDYMIHKNAKEHLQLIKSV